MAEKDFIGQRVELKGNHPHSGERGTIDRIESTLAGPGFVVKLENCQHGTNECFLFKPEHALFLGSKK